MINVLKIVFIVFLFVFAGFFLFRPVSTIEMINRLQQRLGYIKNTASGLFFDTFGYPSDPNMASGDDLLQAVNSYRTQQNLPLLEKKESICLSAVNELNTLPSFVHTKKYEQIKDFDNEERQIIKGKEIIQTFEQPFLAENILNRFWLKPFSQQKNIVNERFWRYGCGAVSGLQLVFIFSR